MKMNSVEVYHPYVFFVPVEEDEFCWVYHIMLYNLVLQIKETIAFKSMLFTLCTPFLRHSQCFEIQLS